MPVRGEDAKVVRGATVAEASGAVDAAEPSESPDPSEAPGAEAAPAGGLVRTGPASVPTGLTVGFSA
jgi:hypothetical protein